MSLEKELYTIKIFRLYETNIRDIKREDKYCYLYKYMVMSTNNYI